MIKQARRSGVIGRLWQGMLDASEFAIAMRYCAPWHRSGEAGCAGRC